MHVFLIVLGGIAGLFAFLFILALFIKKDYFIERTITIHKPSADVFSFIRLLKNQDYYNKWWMADPQAKKEFRGTDGTVGFITLWDSNNKQVGKGEQEIKKIQEGQRIDFEIRFIKPFEGVANTYLSTSPEDDQTVVTWGFEGENKIPMNLIYAVFNLEKVLGNDIRSSLQTLKQSLEK